MNAQDNAKSGTLKPLTFLTRQEVCALLKLSRSTFKRRQNEGLLPPPIKSYGRGLLYLMSEINALAVCYVRGLDDSEIKKFIAEQTLERQAGEFFLAPLTTEAVA